MSGRIDDSTETEDGKREILAHLRPVQRIIGILRRLRSENNVRILSSSMLQVGSLFFGVSGQFIEKNCSGDVRKIMVVNNSETHDRQLKDAEIVRVSRLQDLKCRLTRGYICLSGGVLIISVQYRLGHPTLTAGHPRTDERGAAN